jgi:hypothetical protein
MLGEAEPIVHLHNVIIILAISHNCINKGWYVIIMIVVMTLM